MLFNSFEYGAFLAGVVLIYFLLPYRFRIWLLLAASYFFYMRWQWEYVFLIVAQTLVTYEAGRRIGATENPGVRRAWLAIAVTISLGLLAYYKYANFFIDSLAPVFHAAGLGYLERHLDVILPVGISFYTFQALSYTIDVYRRAHATEGHLGRYALYVAFFPQLVAGPIERATHLLDQFKRRNRFDVERVISGAKLIAWGLFKKVVIADRLAIYVDRVYASPELWSGPTLLIATFFFAFQIYCDFSGYSDIAIGSARILGYDLMRNFRRPYFAHSITEFWKRWHISLTNWFRLYVYYPLGGNRVPYRRWLFNVFVIFILSGFWHGANWTFIMWGVLHGSYYFVESVGTRLRVGEFFEHSLTTYGARFVGILLTFVFVLIGWIFFRSTSVEQAFFILERILTDWDGPIYLGPSQFTTMLSVLLIGTLIIVEFFQEKGYAADYFSPSRFSTPTRWIGYVGLILGIAMLGLSSDAFIYFQF